MTTKKLTSKQIISEYQKRINSFLSGSQCFSRLNSLNWIRHELSTEAEILFQYPDYMPKSQKILYLDFNNIANLGLAWDYIIQNKDVKIDQYQIRKLHTILSQNTNIPAGVYRVSDIYIEQLKTHAPSYKTLLYKMDDIEYEIYNKNHNVLNRAFNVHYDIIALQPFNDFNKRTARLTMNWILIQNNYSPIIFNHKSDKKEYMKALLERANGNCKAYSHYLYECMIRTQKKILKIVSKSNIL